MRRRAGFEALRIGIACSCQSRASGRGGQLQGRRYLVTSSEMRRVSAPVTGSVRWSSSARTVKIDSTVSPLVERSGFACGLIRASTSRYSSKIAFCGDVARECGGKRWMVGVVFAIGAFKPEAGALDEATSSWLRACRHRATNQRLSISRIAAFVIVCRIEQVLSAGLEAPRGSAPVPSRNGRDETCLRLTSGGTRRNRGPRPDCAVHDRAPGWRCHAAMVQAGSNPALVPGQVGMIGTPRAACIREDQDALGPFHEALGFGDIGASFAVEALLTIASITSLRVRPGNLGDGLSPEVLNDCTGRRCDGRQCRAVRSAHRAAMARGQKTGLPHRRHRLGADCHPRRRRPALGAPESSWRGSR